MARHPSQIPAQSPVEAIPPVEERCDRSNVERAAVRLTDRDGRVLTLCRYHFRKYEIPLRMGGWEAEELPHGNE